MSSINKRHLFLIFIVFSILCPSNVLAAGGGDATADPVASTGTNTTSVPNTGSASDLNTNPINQNILPYPSSSFSSSSSFSGYINNANQCGLSISSGYITNGNQNAFQVMSTFNTNPCTNQNNLEKLRQENESKREVTRSNAQIITTCINARLQAVQKNNDPDVICQLKDFPMPK